MESYMKLSPLARILDSVRTQAGSALGLGLNNLANPKITGPKFDQVRKLFGRLDKAQIMVT